jgi:hypothetical protein
MATISREFARVNFPELGESSLTFNRDRQRFKNDYHLTFTLL